MSLKRIVCGGGLIGAGLILEGLRENRTLIKEDYHLPLNTCSTEITIIHLSDLQFPRLRISLQKICQQIKKEQPDCILISGDSIDRTENMHKSRFPAFLQSLCQIAPVYIVAGNHECSCPDYALWKRMIRQSDATWLKNEVEQLTVKGTTINIAGLHENQRELPQYEMAKLQPQQPTLLLAHHPEKIKDYLHSFAGYPLDAVFSGHAHGGQWRVPGIGGLYSPNQGLLPKYTSGTHQFGQTTLFISRGMSNSRFPIRLNNLPHFSVITLTPDK